MSTTALSDTQVLAWARLVRAAQSMLGAIEGDLKTAGFPPLVWYDALLELKRAGTCGLRPFELQHAMLLEQYGVSRLADRLIKVGYVERFECKEDGRGQVLRITAAGRALLKKMWPAYRAAIVAHFAGKLTCADAETLATILAKLK
ncbi:MAG: MarR family winged helix-turn-helix transcriptional regulator [Rhodospirillaceae bacterium]|nr:MarR family winged helix-turn-helix transcriptional regulator [Rhodospirillaceae bacterium]